MSINKIRGQSNKIAFIGHKQSKAYICSRLHISTREYWKLLSLLQDLGIIISYNNRGVYFLRGDEK